MSVKDDLTTLVGVQERELELVRLDGEIAEVESARAAARAEVESAQAVVTGAEADVEAARAEAKRLDLDLKTAEESVAKFKDQMLAVKTNQELWAIQEEIGHAEAAVGEVETNILEQLETADSLEAVIGEKKTELVGVTARVEATIAKADAQEAELDAAKQKVVEGLDVLRERLPADLAKKYESIKSVRGDVAVAEVLDELCLVCNFKVRPQLYVETYNFSDIMQCENCGRILYVAERLGLGSTTDAVATDGSAGTDGTATPDSEPAAADVAG